MQGAGFPGPALKLNMVYKQEDRSVQHNNRWIIAVMVAVLPLVWYGGALADGSKRVPPATIEKLKSGFNRITLTAPTAKRLGIKFAKVTNGTRGLSEVSYNVVLYDNYGKEFAYMSPKPNVFIRTDIKVKRVVGDKAYLSEGPAVGTELVTFGAAELLGIESGIGE